MVQDGETGNGHGRNRWDAPWVKFCQRKIAGFLRGGVSKMFKGRGCSWGTLRIPAGKIGEPYGTLGKIRGITTPLKNPIETGSPSENGNGI